MPTDKDNIESLISTGSDITGAAAGGIVGLLIGGPTGAAIGGPLGILIRKSISDMANRVLSTREQTRVGATAQYAITRVKERLNSGDKLRDDGFFEAKGKGRADAEEIFEGVLLKAKNEHEEKKTKILGNIFANSAFLPGFSAGEANHLLRIAENLTYREMCILSLVKRRDEISGIKLRKDWLGEVNPSVNSVIIDFGTEKASVLQEAYELCDSGLMICSSSKEEITALQTAFDIIPDELELTIMGRKYYEIMELDDILEEDVREVARCLSQEESKES